MGNYVVIYLNRRKGEPLETYIDIEDFDKVNNFPYSWFAQYYTFTKSFYAVSTVYKGIVNGKPTYSRQRLHKLVLDYNGKMHIDHINHDTLDNRKENLRLAQANKNLKNRHGKNSNNTSGYRNVSLDKKLGKWIVQLIVNGKNTVIEKFDDVHKAGAFAKIKREELYGIYQGN